MALIPNPRTMRSDLRLTGFVARMAPDILKARPGSSHTICDVIESFAADSPADLALVMGDRSLTYGQLDSRANQVARWALGQGLGHGDVVALLGGNRPEYIAHWLGLAKIGVVTALINSHLTGRGLARSVAIADTNHLIVDSSLASTWSEALEGTEDRYTVWTSGGPTDGSVDFDEALQGQPTDSIDPTVRGRVKSDDNLFYIYTSGTTGLPKAANFSHQRYLTVATAGRALGNYKSDDNVYSPLPLYHTVGGVMASGGALTAGATAVLAPKFSAGNFWSDCVAHDVTAFHYIGELCRYLLNSPHHVEENRHAVRVCVGNGLRPDIWEEFRDRFGLDQIVEFYGATEGNITFFNLDNKVGSVGRSPWLMRRASGAHLIRYDIESQCEVRGDDGFCVEVGPDESGEAIGKISAATRFEGYSDEIDTEKKILRNVFKDGDAYFRTGDLLRRDSDDYFYFVDRIGDTFRWKGENVSTTEVAEALSPCPGVHEINIYGVAVPGQDGRAGMAAVVADHDFDIDALAALAAQELPTYARPIFVRILSEIDTTGTLKYKKVDAVNDGFDPAVVSEPVYFFDLERAGYVLLDDESHSLICSGATRV